MNRAQRRADEARSKMQHNAERMSRLALERNQAVETADFFRMLLFAHARSQGRFVVKAADIGALGETDAIGTKIDSKTGDITVEYRAGQA